MKLDAQALAANFTMMNSDTALFFRLIVTSSDQETFHLVSDSQVDITIIQDLESATGKTAILEKVEPSDDFNHALLFFATKAGADPHYSWTLTCDEKYRRKCPLNWFQLAETSNPLVRDCQVCERKVHLVQNMDEARLLAQKGWCTACPNKATDNFKTEDDDFLLGDIDIDFDNGFENDPDDFYDDEPGF